MSKFDLLMKHFMKFQKKRPPTPQKDRMDIDDYTEFHRQYKERLEQAVTNANMPSELSERFDFIHCLKITDEKEVYLLQRKSDKVKAILRITKNYPQEDAAFEATLLKTLNHPGIPKVLASYEQKERHFIVREYFEGETLAESIQKNGSMTPTEIRAFVPKICDILSYLHRQNPPVIHRDIKPQNIIQTTHGDIKLIDFGIARKYCSTQDQDTTLVLTRPYASPEQFGYKQSDNRSDIYSLGKVLLYLVTGNEHLTESIKDPHDIDRIKPFRKVEHNTLLQDNHLMEAIAHCIAFDPNRRFQSIQEFVSFLSEENPITIPAASWAFENELDDNLLNEMREEYIIPYCLTALETLSKSNRVNREERFYDIADYLFRRLKMTRPFHYERACPYLLDSVSDKNDSADARYSKCDYTCDGSMYANCDYHEPTYAYFLVGSDYSGSIQEILNHIYEIIDQRNLKKQATKS